MKIADAFKVYEEEEIIAAGLSPKTFETYENCAKLAAKFFNKNTSKITAVDVRGFYQHLLSWQAPDTARGNIICLRAVFRLLEQKKISLSLAANEIKIPKRQKRMADYLTATEAAQFIEVVAEKRRGYAEINRLRNVAVVKVLLSSGIRVSELCRLNRNSIVDRQFTVIGKSKEPRICFITEDAETALNAYLKARSDSSPALFVSNQNRERLTAANVREVFKFACGRSDFHNVHPHTLRHSFATNMLENGVDVVYIGQFLGHQSLDTTRQYLHYANPKLREIYAAAAK